MQIWWYYFLFFSWLHNKESAEEDKESKQEVEEKSSISDAEVYFSRKYKFLFLRLRFVLDLTPKQQDARAENAIVQIGKAKAPVEISGELKEGEKKIVHIS